MNAAVFFSMMVAAAMFLCSGNAWANETSGDETSVILATKMCPSGQPAKISYRPIQDGKGPATIYDCSEQQSPPPSSEVSLRPVDPPRVEEENGLIRNRHILVLDKTHRLCSPIILPGTTAGTSAVICSQDEERELLASQRNIRNRLWNNLAACIRVSVPAGAIDNYDLVDERGESIAAGRDGKARSNRVAFNDPVTIVPDAQCRVNQSVVRVKKPSKAVIARSGGAVTKKPGPRRATRR